MGALLTHLCFQRVKSFWFFGLKIFYTENVQSKMYNVQCTICLNVMKYIELIAEKLTKKGEYCYNSHMREIDY